eukprot:gene40538-53612_t
MHKAPDGNDFLGELKLPQVPDSLDYKVSPEQIPEGILDITSIEGAEGLHNVIAIPPKTLLGNLSKEFVDKRA